jgi:hypothetical protein
LPATSTRGTLADDSYGDPTVIEVLARYGVVVPMEWSSAICAGRLGSGFLLIPLLIHSGSQEVTPHNSPDCLSVLSRHNER